MNPLRLLREVLSSGAPAKTPPAPPPLQPRVNVCGALVGLFLCSGTIAAMASRDAATAGSATARPLAVSNAFPSQLTGQGASNATNLAASPAADAPLSAQAARLTAAGVGSPGTNTAAGSVGTSVDLYRERLESARNLRRQRSTREAGRLLASLLQEAASDDIQRAALLELAQAAQDDGDLVRSQQIYAQFLNRWPDDARVPEVLLRQGQNFRSMGMTQLALAKFYSVMTAALVLKNDQFEYYQRLVLQAQTEIAETHYMSGDYAHAADFYNRLLKQNQPALNRPLAQFRLIRSLHAVGKHDEAVAQARDFLTRYPDAAEQPEVRFCLARSLKELGRSGESLQQVLTLLQEQKAKTRDRPELWAYWQQRTGNEIANQLYRDGDYVRALEVYLKLRELDSSPVWQVPVNYQIGMTYERLMQPEEALKTYNGLLSREAELGTNATPALKAVFDMARWRAGFLQWEGRVDRLVYQLAQPPVSPGGSAAQGASATPPTANVGATGTSPAVSNASGPKDALPDQTPLAAAP